MFGVSIFGTTRSLINNVPWSDFAGRTALTDSLVNAKTLPIGAVSFASTANQVGESSATIVGDNLANGATSANVSAEPSLIPQSTEWHSFLIQVAHEHGLSREQTEVFLLRFGENQAYETIADKLGISKDACLKRLSGVYDKFHISGKTRGKESLLRQKLKQLHNQPEKQHFSSIDGPGTGITEPRQPSASALSTSEPSIQHSQPSKTVVPPSSALATLITAASGETSITHGSEQLPDNSVRRLDELYQDLSELRQLFKLRRINLAEAVQPVILSQFARLMQTLLPAAIKNAAARLQRTELDLTIDLTLKLLDTVKPFLSRNPPNSVQEQTAQKSNAMVDKELEQLKAQLDQLDLQEPVKEQTAQKSNAVVDDEELKQLKAQLDQL